MEGELRISINPQALAKSKVNLLSRSRELSVKVVLAGTCSARLYPAPGLLPLQPSVAQGTGGPAAEVYEVCHNVVACFTRLINHDWHPEFSPIERIALSRRCPC